MPHKVVKRSGSRPYKIVKKLPGGKTKTVGSSASRKKAKMSAGMRDSSDRKR